MTKRLIIMRGISGSGNSTQAKKLQHKYGIAKTVILSTDEFFMVGQGMHNDGVYAFDASLLAHAHAWNLARAIQAMRDGKNVIIDNTNTEPWHYEKYLKFGEDYGYESHIFEVHGELDEEDIKKFHERNTHGVPLDIVQSQYRTFIKTYRERNGK